MLSREELMSEFPIVIEHPVSWGDMDANGHVNNVWFFRYIENARVAYYKKIGKFEYEKETGVTLVIATTSCRLLAPLVYPDTVIVGARISTISDDTAYMSYRVVSSEQCRIVAEAEAAIVGFSGPEGKKTMFPEFLKLNIEKLEKRAF
jgi:acyl-CoA thioester hydrolase